MKEKKGRKNRRRKNLFRSIISFVLVFAMVMDYIPMPYLGEYIQEKINAIKTVQAAGSGEHIVLDGIEAIVNYSKNYDASHKNDIIELTLANDTTGGSFTGYQSIGSSVDDAFDGTIMIHSSVMLRLPVAMFGYITDDVKITDLNGNETAVPLVRSAENADEPLFAKNVVHTRSSGSAEWNFRFDKYHESDWNVDHIYDFAGYIGKLCENANVKIKSIIHNNKTASSTANASSSGDIGLVCCTMDEHSTLEIDTITIAEDELSTKDYSVVSTSSGNAGGLVGSMGDGSRLILGATLINPQNASKTISATSGYAGGIVGYCNGGTIEFSNTTAYSVTQNITGLSGAGGIAGYYATASENAEETDVDRYTVSTANVSVASSCKVNGAGNCGGLFGEVVNDAYMTISGAAGVTINHNSATAESYGGLIGKYTAVDLTDSLTLSLTGTVSPSRSGGSAKQYGGLVGIVDGSSYVLVNGITVSTANATATTNFGGIIGKASEGFIELQGTNTISYSGNATDKTFAGVVGDLENGVLYLQGTTDLSGAPAVTTASNNSGQVVGYRLRGLVFAADGWTMTRPSSDQKLDDVGTWGEVVRFNSSTLKLSDVLTVDSTAHTITISPAVTTIKNLTDFAKTALNIQINNGQTTGVIRCSGDDETTLLGTNLSLSNNITIDLRGTGITGLTRDGSNTSLPLNPYTAEFDGNGSTVILATGENYFANGSEGNGTIYRHEYNGLFGKTEGATVKNLNISELSVMNINAQRAIFAGNVVAQAKGALELNTVKICNKSTTDNTDPEHPVTTTSYATINVGGSAAVYVGGLVGNLTSAGTFSIDSCEYNGEITTSATDSVTGGFIGVVDSSNTFGITIENSKVTGIITTTAGHTGGTIGVINPTGDNSAHKSTGRTLTINGLDIDGLVMSTTDTNGGFLGYGWYETDVEFTAGTGINVKNSSSLTATGNTAGLCYEATGYWKANTGSINLSSMTVTANSATDFGLLINKGYFENGDTWAATGNKKASAIYLELGSKAFTVTKAGVTLNLSTVTVFDELVAYSANGSVLNNGQGIVSINTYDGANNSSKLLKMGNSDTTNTGVTYQHQTKFLDDNSGFVNNPNTRYYYNLDDYKTVPSNDKQKLLVWSVKKYAHSSVSGYFDPRESITSIGSSGADLDMIGYSYYPIDLTGSITISGNLVLHNSEFDTTEGSTTDNRESDEEAQHYLIHNGLFRNVSGSLTFSGSLNGTVNKIGNYCGVLVMGTVSSSSSSNPANITVNGIELDGIKIDGTVGTSDFKPLLINSAGSNAVINISNVSNDSTSYASIGAGADTPAYIASSLLGNIGSSSATGVILNFSGIKLDGRNAAGVTNLSGLTGVYHSKGSIFSKSTLVDTFSYANNSGSYGVYNYTFDEDWGEEDGSARRKVTYGYEIIGTVENIDTDVTPNVSKQRKYNGSGTFTHPTTSSPSDQYSLFTSYFQRYVYTPYTTGGTNHELRVNISTSTDMTGCGTYNDPYVIKTGTDIENIAKLINGTFTETSYTIYVPTAVNDTNKSETWCENKSSHIKYTTFSGNTGNRDTSTWTSEDGYTTIKDSTLGEYLAGAYYKLDPEATANFTLSSGFEGISNYNGNVTAYIFRGVIDGSGQTIVNQSKEPLIVSSYGSVIYNLTVSVQPYETRNLIQSNATAQFSTDKSTSCEAYGAVIGKIFGGDNIIDNVDVIFSTTIPIINANTSTATKANLVPIGGYVGVVVNGGLIFRGMNGYSATNDYSQNGISADNLEGFGTGVGSTPADPTASDNTKWLYVNPVIGRVLNGYAITESSTFKPFEDGIRTYPDGTKEYWHGTSANTTESGKVGVTMRNGTKNYSIADISKTDTSSFQMTNIDDDSNIKVSNAQGLYIMSLITQSGLGKSTDNTTTGTYTQIDELKPYDSYMATHNEANYHYVGGTGSDMTADYGKTSSDKYAGTTGKIPYIIKKYTNTLTVNNSTVYPAFDVMGDASHFYNLVFDTDSATTFYLPDSYRGIGSLMLGVDKGTSYNLDNFKNNVVFLYSMSGNDNTVSEKMNLRIYAEDNYPVMNGNQAFFKTGFGLINCLQSKTVSGKTFDGLTIKGSVSYSLINQNDGKHVDFNSTYVGADRLNNPAVAAFIGVPVAEKQEKPTPYNVTISDINIESMDISGVRYAGGFIGALNVAGIFSFNDCSVDDIKVFAGGAAGGLMGYMRNGSAKIEVTDCEFGIISIISAKNDKADLGADSNAGAGGLIGNRQSGSAATETNLTFNNVTVKNGSSVDKGYIGYYNDGLTTNSKSNPTIPSAGGLIGHANNTSRISADNVTVTNLDICGVYAGGMVGILQGDNSRATFKNSTVTTDNNSKIESMYDNDNSASGGFIGRSNANGISTDTYSLMFDICLVEGYTLSSYKNVGGLIGYNNGSRSVITDNITIKRETLKTNNRAGGMIGNLNNGSLDGYNILIKNQASTVNTASSISNNGYIVGYNNGKIIKLAGFSRQGTIDVDKTVGNKGVTASDRYGSGGYVVFADYNDVASGENPNTKFSTFYGSDLVNVGTESYYRSKTTVTEYNIIATLNNSGNITSVKDVTETSTVTYDDPVENETTTSEGYQIWHGSSLETQVSNLGDPIASVSEFEGNNSGNGFYILTPQVRNGSFTNCLLTSTLSNTAGGYLKQNGNKNSTVNAAIWFFEKNSSNTKYKIYTMVSGTKKYINVTSNYLIILDDSGAEFDIVSSTDANYTTSPPANCFEIIYDSNRYLYYTNGNGQAFWFSNEHKQIDTNKWNALFKFYKVKYNTSWNCRDYSSAYSSSISYDEGTISTSGTPGTLDISSDSAKQNEYTSAMAAYTTKTGDSTDDSYALIKITKTEIKNESLFTNKKPFVTTNPKCDVVKSGETSVQWLTGDGVSGSSYSSSAARDILNAMSGSSNKRYQNTGLVATDRTSLIATLTSNIKKITEASDCKDTYGGEEFPVLVVDDISTANATVNNYLRVLTNTDYDFYNGYSNGTTFNGSDKSIYNVSITKWKYNGDEFVKQDGEASLKCRSDRFYITAAAADNEDWQISLIDVQFYDPANLPAFSGTSRTNAGLIAYHLYVPVVVRKMLHYDFKISAASGTTYALDNYPTSITNVVENLGNPVTIKATYTYRQTASDWTASINSGESVYRYYKKILELTAFGDFPDNAKVVLVDPNGDYDRYYYADLAEKSGSSGVFVYDRAEGSTKVYTLNPDDFSGFSYASMNDLMTISLDTTEDVEKNLVEWVSGTDDPDDIVAIVNDGGSYNGLKLRMAGSGETGKYAVSVALKNYHNNGTRVQENYYLSIFTKPDAKDTDIYHYALSCYGSTLGTAYNKDNDDELSYPTARVDFETTHLFLGNIYTNTVTIYENNRTRLMNAGNDTLDATLTAKVGFTESAINNNIQSFITNDNVHIYQTFMLSLNRLNGSTNERGILVDPVNVIRSDYTVAGDTSHASSLQNYVTHSSYIELPSNYNLKTALSNKANNPTVVDGKNDYTITISERVALKYLESALSVQFPESTASSGSVGTYMIGYSNISSSWQNATSSRASDNTENNGEERLLFYIEDDSTVVFTYNATTNSAFEGDGNGNYGQLGINGLELDDAGNSYVQVNTAGYYNIYSYNQKQQANFVKLTVRLSKKDDGYNEALNIPTYLSDFKIFDADGNEITQVEAEGDNPGTTVIKDDVSNIYTYIIPLSRLKTVSQDAYSIPITFKAYSGDNANFEDKNTGNNTTADMQYSNYKVKVTVGLLKTGSTTEAVLNNSDKIDHVIYTNAKVIAGVIDTSGSGN